MVFLPLQVHDPLFKLAPIAGSFLFLTFANIFLLSMTPVHQQEYLANILRTSTHLTLLMSSKFWPMFEYSRVLIINNTHVFTTRINSKRNQSALVYERHTPRINHSPAHVPQHMTLHS